MVYNRALFLFGVELISMDYFGRLYAVGGYDGASRQCLNVVECYDPEADTWTQVAEMSTRRSGAGVGVLDGQLYAVSIFGIICISSIVKILPTRISVCSLPFLFTFFISNFKCR